MVRDLRFFCDATYTKKKKLRDLRFKEKSELRFFRYATYTFFLTRPTAKKINERGTIFFYKQGSTLFSLRDLHFF